MPGAGRQGHRGVAFIEFSNQVDANNALKLDGHILNSRPIKVTPSDNQVQALTQRQSQMVFVTNLPYDVTTDELRAVFSPAGEIADIRIPLEKEGKNRGFAYVEFVQSADAIKALGMDKTEIKKRNINVEPYVRVLSRFPNVRNLRPQLARPRQPHGRGQRCWCPLYFSGRRLCRRPLPLVWVRNRRTRAQRPLPRSRKQSRIMNSAKCFLINSKTGLA